MSRLHRLQALTERLLREEQARAQAEAADGRRRLQAEHLAAAAHAMAGPLDLRARAEAAVSDAVKMFEADAASIRLFQPDGALRVVAAAGVDPDLTGLDVIRDPRILETVRRAVPGEAMWSRDLAADSRVPMSDALRTRVRACGFTTVVAVGLAAHGTPLGLFVVAYRQPREFQRYELFPFDTFAGLVAVMLHNAQVVERAELRADRLSTLARVTKLVSSSLDLTSVLKEIATAASQLMDMPQVRIRLVDDRTRTIAPSVVVADDSLLPIPSTAFRYGQGMSGMAAAHRRVIDVPDIHACPFFIWADAWAPLGITSARAIPIMDGDEVIGIMNLMARKPIILDEDETQLLDTFVAHAAQAIQNAKKAEALRVQNERLRQLQQLTRLLTSPPDLERTLQAIASAAAQLMRVPQVRFRLYEAATRTLRPGAVHDPRLEPPDEPLEITPLGRGVSGLAVEQRATIVSPDIMRDPRVYRPERWARLGLTSVVATPVAYGQQVLAVMNLFDRKPIELDPAETELLEAFVAQAALAIYARRAGGRA